MAKTIELKFRGYFKESLPSTDRVRAGIYVVYTGQRISEKECNLQKLLYIGRSNDVTERPGKSHHKYESWCSHRKKGEDLYFSFAYTDDEERAEAALIYKAKPVCNDTGKDGFHHPETTIKTSGSNAGLGDSFTVQETD
jgi:hypothetical protein